MRRKTAGLTPDQKIKNLTQERDQAVSRIREMEHESLYRQEAFRARAAELEVGIASALKAHTHPQDSSDEAWGRENPCFCDSCLILRVLQPK
jgi:hypothetical protein